jgi:tetratricopeptide (TPR) repeat protein
MWQKAWPWLLVVSLFPVACATHPQARAPRSADVGERKVVPKAVAEADFGKAVQSLLVSDEASQAVPDRLELLSGAVQTQLVRAERWFEMGQRSVALAAVRGAILLVRSHEGHSSMWTGRGRILGLAAEEAARVGDEGTTRAFYSLLLQSDPSRPLAKDAREHLVAMDRFAAETPGLGPLEIAGRRQEVAVRRAIFDPSPSARRDAVERLTEWLGQADSSDVRERSPETPDDREEAIAAFRALRFGIASLVGVYLRDGDAIGAEEALQQPSIGKLASQALGDRVEKAAKDDEPSAWMDLFRLYQSATLSQQTDVSIDEELARAAAFGAAVELYRTAPRSVAAAGALSMLVTEYAMPDVAMALLTEPMSSTVDAEELAWTLGIVHRALVAASQIGDIELARRILEQSRPIVEPWMKEDALAALRPHVAQLYRTMADAEGRGGSLSRSVEDHRRALLLRPSTEGYLALGRVERQRGEGQGAIDALARAVESARAEGDGVGQAEAYTHLCELQWDRGRLVEAGEALERALVAALGARKEGTPPLVLARAERQLARILELYGDEAGARRATDRALLSARSDPQQVGATLLEVARRALTRGDLADARMALREILSWGLEPEVRLYAALWLRMVERERHTTPSGDVEEAIARLPDLSDWDDALRRWSLDQLTAEELSRSARTPLERIESGFYRALAARHAGNAELSHRLLGEVARSSGVDLIEVTVAHDLIRRDQGTAPLTLPARTVIP